MFVGLKRHEQIVVRQSKHLAIAGGLQERGNIDLAQRRPRIAIVRRSHPADVDWQKPFGFRVHQKRRVIRVIDPCEQHGDLAASNVADRGGAKISELALWRLARERYAVPRFALVATTPEP